MSDFQTVKRRGHSQSANSKYPEQHQQLVEMGFDTTSVSRALDSSNGDMEAATAVLIGEDCSKQDTEEKIGNAFKEKKLAATTLAAAAAVAPAAAEAKAKSAARQSASLASVSGPAVKEIKDTHQKMMATYKVQKCKETGAHDRKMCMHYHSLSDRRRNPFEILYSCYECPNTVDGGECPDGDSCMHSHTMLERMFHPELYKISVCQRQLTGNKCDRAMLCAFAHNDADLRISPSHLTTKYAMQEEAKSTPVPVSQSPMLDHIRSNLVKLVKEHGSEGIIAADLPKYYQGKFHESLDIIDETGKKYKLKDLIGPHNNIHVVLTGQPKFVFGDPSTTTHAPEISTSNVNTISGAVPTKESSVSSTAPALSVKDRVVELIKAAGTEGILATDMPKKYQDRYGEKLEKDWTVGLNVVAGMVLTQTKQYTKYTFNPITAGIKDAAIPVATTKEGKSPVSTSAPVLSTVSKAGASAVSTAAAPTAPPAASGSKWGSSAGKSFASILASASSSNGAPSVAATTSGSETTVEPSTPSTNGGSASLESTLAIPASSAEPRTPNQKPVKVEKVLPSSKLTAAASNKTESKGSSIGTVEQVHAAPSEKEATRESSITLNSTSNNESVLGMHILQNPASPSSASVSLTIGSSPPSRAVSDVNGTGGLPKPLFGGLSSQLGVTGLDSDQFSLSSVTGLGGNGSSLLDLTGSSLSGAFLQSSFDLPLVDGVDLNSSSVLPPGLSKTIGKPNASSSVSSAPSLSSILGTSLGTSAGLVGLPLSSNSTDTPERNISSGTTSTVANTSNMSQTERIALLERELFSKTQEADALSMDVATLRSRVTELENAQLAHDDRLRSSILEKDIELLARHQEVSKFEEESRKMKEEKLVDLDQYFIYFSKIEEVINGMKCKDDVFSDKVKPDDVQELFQFKKLIRNYVANVKVQLKNKFDAVVAQTHIVRTSSGTSVGKDLSVEAVALGMALPAGPPPGGLTSSATGITGGNATSPSTSTNLFGILSSGSSASSSTSGSTSSVTGTSRFTASFDSHSLPFHNNHHNVLGSVVDAFASSSVLFPSSSADLNGSSSSSSVLSSAKHCGLPGCFKEGLYTCAGCRKISYCGEAHQRSHWAQHSQNCYQR
jgi:hypothetical protein